MDQRDRLVLIAGAGLGGLAAALGCLRRGIPVHVLEQAPELGEVGAGVTLYRNASRALRDLGVLDAVAAEATQPEGRLQLHYQTGDVLLHWPKNRPNANEDVSEYRVHRVDLHNALASAVRDLDPDAIQTGAAVTGFEQDAEGVTVRLGSGAALRGAALIGADGIRSAVLEQLWGVGKPHFTGWVAWRGLVDRDAVPEACSNPSSAKYIGDHQEIVRYLVRRGRSINYVALKHQPGWEVETWTEPATVDEVLGEYRDWHEPVRDLIAASPPHTLFKWALFDRDPLPAWTQGRVTLLGDAAHPMLPSIGQGAGMALEDGVVLARCLERYGVTRQALDQYESARRPRTSEAQLLARASEPGVNADQLDAYAKSSSTDERNLRQRALQDYDPATAPI